MIRLALTGIVVASLGTAHRGVAQASRARQPGGAFMGRLRNAVDSAPVQRAEVRLIPIDSTRPSERMDEDKAIIFVDSTRARLAITDSAGSFAIRALDRGRYVMQVRRLGFTAHEGVLTIDTIPVRMAMAMEPSSQLLAGMTITETSIDRNGKYLKNVGYTMRSQSGLGGRYISAAQIDHNKWLRIDELLLAENVKYDPRLEVRIDNMPVRLDEAMNYPTNLIVAVEVYRRQRPLDFDHSGKFSTSRPLVLIWTFQP